MNLEKYKVFYEKFLVSSTAIWLKFILGILATWHLSFLIKSVQNILPDILLKYFIYGTPLVLVVIFLMSTYCYKSYFLNSLVLFLIVIFMFMSNVALIALKEESLAHTYMGMVVAFTLFGIINYIRTYPIKNEVEKKSNQEEDKKIKTNNGQ